MRRRSISSHVVKYRPQRTCLACRQIKVKGELIRLVRLADGSVEVDTGGKRAGRGAYLCQTQECWQGGLKGGRLEHSLRTTLTPDNREQLIRFGKDFLQERVSDQAK
ncbi:MAG: YlxR family protein [Chloroflexi bacterium]|nr:YlxR family protein [Chloroflexota bacterium]MBI3930751.1 YlxR family protein [Chloroflexota bacterium]